MYRFFRQTHFILLAACTLTLSFSLPHFNHTGLLIILLAVNGLAMIVTGGRLQMKKPGVIILLFILLYLINIPGLFISDNLSGAVFVLEKKLSILIFPLLFYFSQPLTVKEGRFVLLSFVMGCIFTAIYSSGVALAHFVLWNDPAYFFYRIFSNIVGMHAIYLSMYYCFAVATLLYLFAGSYSRFNIASWALYILGLLILVFSIIQLAGRVSLFLLISGTIVYLLVYLRRRFRIWQSVLISLSLGILVFFIAMAPPKNRLRLAEVIKFESIGTIEGQASGAAVRPYIWSCTSELIRSRPLSGVGTGDLQTELTNCYEMRGYDFLTRVNNMQFNAHNQYLEVALGTGLAGLLIFLLNILIPGRIALKNRNYLYLIFLVIFCVSCFTESMLERQSGITFFALFNSMLFFGMSGKIKTDETDDGQYP